MDDLLFISSSSSSVVKISYFVFCGRDIPLATLWASLTYLSLIIAGPLTVLTVFFWFPRVSSVIQVFL